MRIFFKKLIHTFSANIGPKLYITEIILNFNQGGFQDMRFFIKIFFIFLIVLILGIPIVFVLFGLQSTPLIVSDKKLTFQDVARVKHLIKQNNPRKFKQGEIKNIKLEERDINLILQYALSNISETENMAGIVNINNAVADGYFTIRLPENPFGSYLNISIRITEFSRIVKINKLKVGSIPIPGLFINLAAKGGHKLLIQSEEYQKVILAVNSIKDISFNNDTMSLTYQWQPDVLRELRAEGRDFLLSENEQKRLLVYNKKIAEISKTINTKSISLTKFTKPLFKLAKERTVFSEDPISENKALILSLATYAVGKDINKILGNSSLSSANKPCKISLTLKNRRDLALHFLVSAAISCSGGSRLANLAGIFKEMDDSQGGSGFSFADLAADRAGVTFAEGAINSSNHAMLMQLRMSQTDKEMDFMPMITNLPEGIQELEFKRKFKDLDSSKYRLINDEIEQRIKLCRVYR